MLFWYLKICLVFFTFCFLLCNGNGGSDIEDHLETEIEFKDPRSFKQLRFKNLSVRQFGFKNIFYNTSGAITMGGNVNWEVFSFRYWYETRAQNAVCPMTPSGIAAECDWAMEVPCLFTANPRISPKFFHVHTDMLPHFVESTLNFMDPSYRFILITSGTDATIPRSIDPRFHLLRGFGSGPDGGAYYQRILSDERIIHWFAENHDMTHEKISTLPTGMATATAEGVDDVSEHPNRAGILEITKRPLQFVLSDRVRGGSPQWNDRSNAATKCDDMISRGVKACIRPPNHDDPNGIPKKDFLLFLVQHAFVACVHGGGIDPSPKAWEAIMVGTIPIIQHSALDDAYERFPVMFVTEWSEIFDNPNVEVLLQSWLTKLAPFYEEGSKLRQHVLERLTTAYWLELMDQKYRDYHTNHTTASASAASPAVKRAVYEHKIVEGVTVKKTTVKSEKHQPKPKKDRNLNNLFGLMN